MKIMRIITPKKLKHMNREVTTATMTSCTNYTRSSEKNTKTWARCTRRLSRITTNCSRS